MKGSVALTAGILALHTTAASADWQYTRWGMTEAEVIAASGRSAVPVTVQESQGGVPGTVNLLAAPYTAGPYQFRAIFAFDPSRHLTAVLLRVLNKGDGYAIKNDLMGKYGRPMQDNRTSYGSVTRWQTELDEIQFNDVVGSSFSVTYTPRHRASTNGL